MSSSETKLFLGILAVAVVLAAIAIYPAMVNARNQPMGPVVIKDPVKAKVTRQDLFPAGSWHKGDPKAPYLLVEFADYLCPACANAVEKIPEIMDQNKGKFCYVFHGIQISSSHQNALIMGQAAEAAGMQGKFWEMHALLFKKQRLFMGLPEQDAIDTVNNLSKEVGLDMLRFGADLQSFAAIKGQERSSKVGIQATVNVTPTFFVVPPSGPTLKLQSMRELTAWIEKQPDLKNP